MAALVVLVALGASAILDNATSIVTSASIIPSALRPNAILGGTSIASSITTSASIVPSSTLRINAILSGTNVALAAVTVRNALVVLVALGASAILGNVRGGGGGGGRRAPGVVLITSHALAILDSALLADDGFWVVLSLDSAATTDNLLLRIQAVSDAGSVAVGNRTAINAGFELATT